MSDKFAPLSAGERASLKGAKRDDGELIMPVPADAPPMPSAHPKLGKPTATWRYLDASGALLFVVHRFDPPGKEFRPITLWRDASDLRWRWESAPAPRPLYGLNWLASAPDALVIVCEGEKAADAADQVFPDRVCMTSPNGAESADHADWTPLAHRKVSIWPDADKPGLKYASEVGAILHRLGCEVSIIDANALASITPGGGQREPVKGWDAANGIEEWSDKAALGTAVVGHAKLFQPPAAVYRLPVRFEPARPNVTADQAEKAILAAGFPVFHRSGMLVEPCIERFRTYGGERTQAVVLKAIEQARLIDLMSSAAVWEKYSTRERKHLPSAPPSIAAEILLARAGHWAFPRISGVITTPTLRRDGSIVTDAGYDLATQLYHAADPNLVLPRMSDKPTKAEALAAMELLEDLLSEFPFADPQIDKSVALSALMTPVIRAALDVVPMHAIKAPAYGSGKTFLVNLASAIAAGACCPVITAGRDEGETEKRLDAALLECQPMIALDNVNAELCSDKLAIAIEQPMISVRILGHSKTIKIDNRACIFATGCNLTVRGDMVRRTLLCSIDPNEEAPEKRSFARNPLAEILADRGKYIAAVMTVARAYLCAGEPEVECSRLASFSGWSRFVQKPLIWLGRADPVRSVEASEQADPERGAILELLAPWHEAIGEERVTLVQLEAKIQAKDDYDNMAFLHPDLRAALMYVAPKRDGTLDTVRLGNWLKTIDGRVVGGLKIMKCKERAGGGKSLWCVVQIASRKQGEGVGVG